MQTTSTFKKSTILFAGLIIGIAGTMVVQDPPATILVKHRNEYLQGNTTLLNKLNHLEQLLNDLKTDVLDIKNHSNKN